MTGKTAEHVFSENCGWATTLSAGGAQLVKPEIGNPETVNPEIGNSERDDKTC
jgi:hypothetical protein